MRNHENTELDLVGCPQCDAPAEIIDRFELPGSDGPVEHVKVQCLHRHWFMMEAARLVPVGSVARPVSSDPISGEEPVRWNR